MYTKVFFFVAAIAFQCFIHHSEAATPEELLNQLRELVYSSVEDGIKTLTTTLEESKSKTSGIQDNAKVQLEDEKKELLKEFEVVKAQAEAADASDCVAGDEGQIDYFFNSYYLHSNYCVYYYYNTVDGLYKGGVEKLQKLKNLEPELRKELEDCGDSADCKDKVAAKISEAIQETPEKAKTIIDKAAKAIGVDSLNECVDEQVQKFHDGVKYIIKVAKDCVDNKK